MKFAILALSLFVLSCSGSTTTIGATSSVSSSPGNVNWTLGVNIGITVARSVLPAAQTALDSNPAISVSAKASIDTGFRAAIDALPLAQTALDTFSHAPSAQNLCQVHFYVEQALTAALQAIVVARDAGATIDPMFASAIGGLGSIADEVFSGSCSSGSGAPAMIRPVSAQERVQAALRVR